MKKLELFRLEDYFAPREFKANYMISGSDPQSMSVQELLNLADSEAQALWQDLMLHYTETEGHPLLREEIAKLYGPNINAENILCFSGAEEGIYCMAMQLLSSEDHVIVVTPCYQSLKSVAQSICDITEVPLQENQQWALDMELLQQAIRPNTKLLVVNFPHNPTGTTISTSTQHALIEFAQKNDLFLFSDEVYRLMEIDTQDRLDPVASLYEKGMSLGVMSKSFGLPGLRIGWIVSQDTALLKSFNQFKHYLTICNSAPSETLALIALRAKDSILHKNHTLMTQNLEVLDSFLQQHASILSWVRPKGGCTGFVKFQEDSINIEHFADFLLETEQTLILPGTMYDVQKPYFRIGFGRSNFQEGLQRLEQGLSRYLQ